GDTILQLPLEFNQFDQLVKNLFLNSATPISQPYWLKSPHPIGYYHIPDQLLVGRPQNPPSILATFYLKIGDQVIPIKRAVRYKYADPVRGEVHEPLVVTPPVTANLEHQVYVFTHPHPQQIRVNLKSFADQIEGVAQLQLPEGYQSSPKSLPFSLLKKGDEKTLVFSVVPLKSLENSSWVGNLKVLLEIGGHTYDRGIQTIDYSHIPKITVFPLAQTKLVHLDLKTAGKKIGYIMGAGDMVPEALQQIGYQVTPLNENKIGTGYLKQFDAIITGVRAYNVDKRLKFFQRNLLAYVHQGGILVVQYNNNFNLVTEQLGPYPFELTFNRVTEEDAPVTFLQPDNPILLYPNKITAADFKGWIQERGLYFTSDQDAHYQKIFSMHDTGSPPLEGSTLVAHFGKGKYVYTCLDFFRELPAGVPGAFRLFVNFISTNQLKSRVK
ncbi:MAG: LmbE family protein, partial [Chitinophagaceae bacterium]